VSGLLIPEGMSAHLTGPGDVAFVAAMPGARANLAVYDGVEWLHVAVSHSGVRVSACCIAAEAPPEALALLPKEAP